MRTCSALPACVFLAALTPVAAWSASSDTRSFSIRAKTASEALIDFAVQSNISIGGVESCRGPTAGLVGRFAIEDGLQRLLAGTGCAFRRVAPDAYQISARPPA